ncbi:MAG: hypothetical protein ACRCTZ_12675 [Sarcina sp.]
MDKINIVIVNTDIIYMNKLKIYMLKKYSDKFNINCISDLDLLKLELESLISGVLLITEEIYINKFRDIKFDEIIILSENIELREIDNNKVLSKYSSANKLCEEINYIYKNRIKCKG